MRSNQRHRTDQSPYGWLGPLMLTVGKGVRP